MTKTKTKLMIAFTIVVLCMDVINAQESLNAAGGVSSGSGGNAAYSVGQVVYTTFTNDTGTIGQGVQQAFEIYTLGNQKYELFISLKVYPNPIVDNLTLQLSDYNGEQLSYQLFDMQGRLLRNEKVTGQETQINMTELASAVYFINVLNEQQNRVQSFKIIKK